MQSLVLATSLLLSSQSPVIATDIQSEVSIFVELEASKVTQVIQFESEMSVNDNFLYPDTLVARQTKQDKLTVESTEMAEE